MAGGTPTPIGAPGAASSLWASGTASVRGVGGGLSAELGGGGAPAPPLVNTGISERGFADGEVPDPRFLTKRHGLPWAYIRACAKGRYHLRTWKQSEGPAGAKAVPFRCRSWRHKGPCAKWKASQDFQRISQALGQHDPRDVLFAVLTFDPKRYADEFEAYAELVACWRRLARSLREELGEVELVQATGRKRTRKLLHKAKLEFVSTVEKTRRGWPHLNVILVCPTLAEQVRADPARAKRELSARAAAAGFGWVVSLEEPRGNTDTLAGYIVKLASLHETTAGEVVKLSQLPTNAPPGFRRLRSSPGFLPKPHKDPECCGELVRASLPTTPPEEALALEEGRYTDDMGSIHAARRTAQDGEVKELLHKINTDKDWKRLKLTPKEKARAVAWVLHGPGGLPGPDSGMVPPEPVAPKEAI